MIPQIVLRIATALLVLVILRPASADFRIDDEPEQDLVDERFLQILAKASPVRSSVVENFDIRLFGVSSSRGEKMRRLECLLHEKVETVERACMLTESQRAKLMLAGRGDIKWLFNRIDDGRRQLFEMEAGKRDQLFIANQMQNTVKGVRPDLNMGPFDRDSLFAKTMHHTLTAAQLANLAAMAEIERLGGRVARNGRGAGAVSEVCLDARAVTDNGLAATKNLPNLRLLSLAFTRVADAGLVHVAGLKSLEVLDLCDTQISGAGLIHLKDLLNLQVLLLRNTQADDAGLAHLTNLAQLKELHLQSTLVTNNGLRHLAPLRGLELLNLGRTRVTDAGLAALDLPARANLKELGLARTGVTDAGLAHMKDLASLERLYVNGTQITDAGLVNIASLRKLKLLCLDDLRITDAGLSHLTALSELERLDLGGTLISDAGLAHIYGLTKLKRLDLANTHVTSEGIAALQRTLPEVVVTR